MARIKVLNGIDLEYSDNGKGADAIVWVHGLSLTKESWFANIPALENSLRCLAIDLPGNGGSAAVREPYTLDLYAKCLIDFIGRMQLGRVVLAGHSMGAQVILHAVLMEPRVAEKLILFAPSGFETYTHWERTMFAGGLDMLTMFTTDEQNLRNTIYTGFSRFSPMTETLIERSLAAAGRLPAGQHRRMVNDCIRTMLYTPVFDHLKRIAHPALVFFGADDQMIPQKLIHPYSTAQVARAGCRELQNAELVLLKDCGHFPQIEQAKEVNKRMIAWLGGLR